MMALSRFAIPKEIFTTTDGYNYESVLETASARLGIRIRRQRCLFHIEKDLAHWIKDAKMEVHLEMAKKLGQVHVFPERNKPE